MSHAETPEALLAGGPDHPPLCGLLLHQELHQLACEGCVPDPIAPAGVHHTLLLCQCAEDSGGQDHGVALS